jgi:hypothetical protein
MAKQWNINDINYIINNVKKMTLRDIAKELNRSISSVSNKIHKMNIVTRKWSVDEDELLIKEYPNKPIRILEKMFKNRSKSSLMNRATLLKLKRNNDERIKYKEYKYMVNHNFFSEYNLESCYWAGFISADGWIDDKKCSLLGIKLSKKDIEHLKIFKLKIETDSPIKVGNGISFNKEVEYCKIIIYSRKIVDDLKSNFNVTKNKTLTNTRPKIDSLNNKLAFICGLLDGDGSVYKINNKNRVTFLGTKDILCWVKETLNELIEYEDLKVNILKKGNIFSLGLSGRHSDTFLDWVNKNDLYCLERKIKKHG